MEIKEGKVCKAPSPRPAHVQGLGTMLGGDTK